MHVVARVEVIDRLSRGKLVSEYCYHHGYWDGLEREFRGFGRVDQRDTQLFEADFHAPGLHPGFEAAPVPAFSPPLETRTWFHQGAVEAEAGDWGESDLTGEFWTGDRDFGGDFWADDPPRPPRLKRPTDTSALLGSLPPRARRDAIRSLRGSVVRTELYALDGSEREQRPYTVTESIYGVCQVVEDGAQARLVCGGAAGHVAGGAEGLRVFFPQLRATRITQWERGEDPLTTLAYTDGYDAFGRPDDQTAIALPRRAASRRPSVAAVVGTVPVDETRVLATITRTAYAVPDATAYPDLYLHDRVAHVVTFELAQPPRAAKTDPQDLAAVRHDQGAAAQHVHEAFQATLDGWTVGDPIPTPVRLIGHTRALYDGAPFTGREDGKLGPHGAATRSETLVFTTAELNAAYGRRRPAYLGGPAALPPGAPAASAPTSVTTCGTRPSAPAAPAGTPTHTVSRPTRAASSSPPKTRSATRPTSFSTISVCCPSRSPTRRGSRRRRSTTIVSCSRSGSSTRTGTQPSTATARSACCTRRGWRAATGRAAARHNRRPATTTRCAPTRPPATPPAPSRSSHTPRSGCTTAGTASRTRRSSHASTPTASAG